VCISFSTFPIYDFRFERVVSSRLACPHQLKAGEECAPVLCARPAIKPADLGPD